MASQPSTTIANEFIRIANAAGDPVTHLKLQKLVYFAHGWHLAIFDKMPLIRESVEAWDHGPVIRKLYAAFASYGRRIIDGFYSNYLIVDDAIQLVEPELPESNHSARAIIDRIWEVYGRLTAFQLSAISHEPGSPWDRARKAGRDVIPNDDIYEYFRGQIKTG